MTDTSGTQLSNTAHFVNRGVKLFFNAQHLLIRLTPYERCFFDFLCERMLMDSNEVYIDKLLKEDFKSLVSKIGEGVNKVQPAAIAGFVAKLKELKLIISTGDRAYYIVNPKYVFKGTDTKRKECLYSMIQTRINRGESIDFLLGEQEATFLQGFKSTKK